MSYCGWNLTAERNRIAGFIGMTEVRIQNVDVEDRC
jgi:hypothetical protein